MNRDEIIEKINRNLTEVNKNKLLSILNYSNQMNYKKNG